jgi:hypothetical protein
MVSIRALAHVGQVSQNDGDLIAPEGCAGDTESLWLFNNQFWSIRLRVQSNCQRLAVLNLDAPIGNGRTSRSA